LAKTSRASHCSTREIHSITKSLSPRKFELFSLFGSLHMCMHIVRHMLPDNLELIL
jgi:hypothetical protein